jgi:nucleoporin NDC1
MEIVSRQELIISHKHANPNDCLYQGLRGILEKPDLPMNPIMKQKDKITTIELYQRFAFNELLKISKFNEARRKTIFKEIDDNPNAWQKILCACLLIITDITIELQRQSEEVEVILSKGKKVRPVRLGSKIHVSSREELKDIYHRPSRGLSGALMNTILGIETERKQVPASKPSSHVPSVFISEQDDRKVEIDKPAVEKGFHYDKLMKYKLGKKLLLRVKYEQVIAQFQAFDIVENACLGLSHLLSASFKEDPYGLVQKDIKKVLEAFLDLITALERYHKVYVAYYFDKRSAEYESVIKPLFVLLDGKNSLKCLFSAEYIDIQCYRDVL